MTPVLRALLALLAVAAMVAVTAQLALAQCGGRPPWVLSPAQPCGLPKLPEPLKLPNPLGGTLQQLPDPRGVPRAVAPGTTRPSRPSGPSDSERLRRGMELLNRRDYAGAIGMLHPIRDRYPQARQGVIYAMLQQKRYQDAAFELEKAKPYPGRDQNLLFAYTKLAVGDYEAGYPDLAVKALTWLKRHNQGEAVRLLREIGDRELAKSAHASAVLAYAAIGDDARALKGKAQAEFAQGQYEQAFRTLDAYARHDKRDATFLKGDLLLSINAIPLAIEAYTPYANDKAVRTVLERLNAQGLAKYRKTGFASPDWQAFEAESPGPDVETRTLLFPMVKGKMQPGPVFELTRYKAPRAWSAGMLPSVLWNWRWPETGDAREHRLAVNQPGGSHVAAFWSEAPAQDELMKALAWARKAAPDIRQGDALEHQGKPDKAVDRFARASGMTYITSDKILDWPHYAGLERLLQLVSGEDAPKKGIYDRERAIERVRTLLYDYFPHWGRLAWARALVNQGRMEEARAVWEEVADTWSGRHESWTERGQLEWDTASETTGPERDAIVRNAQAAWEKVLQIKPDHTGARLKLAQIYLLYGAHALAAESVTVNNLHKTHAKHQGVYDYLGALRQRDFEMLGTVTGNSGMRLTVYRNRGAPPADATLIHHAAEIVVRDEHGLVRETFAIASQALLNSDPRDYFLDRVTASGREMLARYGRKPPDPDKVAEELAKL